MTITHQPIRGRCALCDRSVLYVVLRLRRADGDKITPGEVVELEPDAKPGKGYVADPDGSGYYRTAHLRSGEVGHRIHRCGKWRAP